MIKKKDLALAAGQAVEIRAANFAVEARAGDGDNAWVEYTAADDPAAPDAVEVTTTGGRLLITAYSDYSSGERLLKLSLPVGEREVAVEIGNGRILLEGLSGRIRAHATNGRVDLRRLEGEIGVLCGNGSVDAADVRGSLDVSTANGRIVVKGATLKAGSLKSGSGRVAVQVSPGGPATLGVFAGNGRVELALPHEAGFRIRVRTSGRLQNHLESYSVSSDREGTVVERGNGELAVLIQGAKGVRLVKYEDFGKEWDDAGPIPGLGVEDMQDLFDRLGSFFGDARKGFDFSEEIPRIARKMQGVGARFGFHEAHSGSRDREIDMVLGLLKEGRISAEEAERLINAVRQK